MRDSTPVEQTEQLYTDPRQLAPDITVFPPSDWSMLGASQLSAETHEAFRAHFLSLLPQRRRDITFRRSVATCLNFEITCYNSYRTLCAGPTEAFNLPLPLQQIAEQGLIFQLQTISPRLDYFLSGLFLQTSNLRSKHLALVYTSIFGDLGSSGRAPSQRWATGLMRAGQMRLLILSLRKMLEQLEALFKAADELGSNRNCILQEFEYICWQSQCLIPHFLAHLRSERLELLLEKYLAEDGVNMKVLKGIEAADRLHLYAKPWDSSALPEIVEYRPMLMRQQQI